MKPTMIGLILMVLLGAPLTVHAVDKVDFEVRTTKNLLNLCTASPEDNHYAEAINYCHGYLIGAYHYYEASRKGPNATPLVCVPEPHLSRNQTIDMFVAWAKDKPEHHAELPVETEFRFLAETWPCD